MQKRQSIPFLCLSQNFCLRFRRYLCVFVVSSVIPFFTNTNWALIQILSYFWVVVGIWRLLCFEDWCLEIVLWCYCWRGGFENVLLFLWSSTWAKRNKNHSIWSSFGLVSILECSCCSSASSCCVEEDSSKGYYLILKSGEIRCGLC